MLRCAWCHDDAPRGEARCAGCGTIVHVECLSALVGCTTIGCDETPRPPKASRVIETLVSLAFDAGFTLAIVVIACACLLSMTRQILGSF